MNWATAFEQIEITKGDITREETDAIVNAANPSLLGGGGVDGAIHRAAGPELLKATSKLGGCQPGESRITPGFNLKASYVIHTPGPVYRGGKNGEDRVLASSYSNSLQLALNNNCKSVSFPAISTGVYGYPLEEASRIALRTTLDFLNTTGSHMKVRFVLFDDENDETYRKILEQLRKEYGVS
jgi:O-acetyl-ADP-ribose deacetylase (regulator of RNase III)